MFRIARVTDTHLYSDPKTSRDVADAAFADRLREVAAHGVEMILHTGDFCHGSTKLEGHQRFKALLDRIGDELDLPIHVVRGNHDATISDEQYHSVYGEGTYWLEHNGWAIVGLDRYYRTYQHTLHAYAMAPETLDALRRFADEIPRDMPIILMLHDDPIGVSRFHRGPEIFHVLQHHNLKLVLFGHVQANYLGAHRGVPFSTVVGDDRPHDTGPLTYEIITCHDDRTVETDWFPHRVNAPAPPPVAQLLSGRARAKPRAPWPNLRGPGHDRRCQVDPPDEAPSLAWQSDSPGGFGMGGPTCADGSVYATTLCWGRLEQCIARCWDAATGDVRWTTQLDGPAEGGLTLDGSVGYCATSVGSVHCLDLDDGSIRWSWNNRDNMPFTAQPVVHEGLVHVGANWEAYALDASSGECRWRVVATPNGFPYMGPGNAAALVVGDRVFHQRTFNSPLEGRAEVQSVDASTGRGLQVVVADEQMHPMFRHASPILHRGRLCAAGSGLLVIDPDRPDGYERWFNEPPMIGLPGQRYAAGSTTPAAADGVVYVSYHREVVAYQLDGADEPIWRTPHEPGLLHCSGGFRSRFGTEPPYGSYAAPLVGGDKLIVCDTGGRVRCLGLDDGRERWRIELGRPIWAAPAASGNALWVADYFGRLHAFAW